MNVMNVKFIFRLSCKMLNKKSDVLNNVKLFLLGNSIKYILLLYFVIL